VCLILLVSFVAVCGVHAGGTAHHDAAGDSLVLAILLAVVAAIALVSRRVETDSARTSTITISAKSPWATPAPLAPRAGVPLLR